MCPIISVVLLCVSIRNIILHLNNLLMVLHLMPLMCHKKPSITGYATPLETSCEITHMVALLLQTTTPSTFAHERLCMELFV